MPELRILMSDGENGLRERILDFAAREECEAEPLEAGWLLLPEVMLRKYGIFVLPCEEGWKICREEDATTWEDYLMMKLAHTLAEAFAGVIYPEGWEKPLATAPEKFATFDHYAEAVVEGEEELVKDMKKYWIYNHKKRALR